MITIQPEAKSQLLCVRCGHSEDEHNWQSGPCNETHCTCYAFSSPLKLTCMRCHRTHNPSDCNNWQCPNCGGNLS